MLLGWRQARCATLRYPLSPCRIDTLAELEQGLEQFEQYIIGYEHIQPLIVREKASLRYGLLAVQLLIVYWFFPHEEPAVAHRNHAAFRWIDQHRHEFMSGLAAGRAVE